jgi:hypothetical protein
VNSSSARIRLSRPLDLARTLAGTRPARVAAPGIWRATRTPVGPGTEWLWLEGDVLRIEAWGPGADWLCQNAPALVGELDDDAGQLQVNVMRPGDAIHIEPGRRHRMVAIEECDVFEVSTPELDDVVRLEDRYGCTVLVT